MYSTAAIHEITSVFETNDFKIDLHIFVLSNTQNCTFAL